MPCPGESLRAWGFTVEPGGKGFNLAVGARRLGARVEAVFAVGDDLFAGIAPRALEEAGLPCARVHRVAGATGSGIGFTDAAGENCLAVSLGANLALSAAHVREAEHAIRAAALVLAQFEIGDEPIREAFRLARAAGRRTLLNPSPFRPIDPDLLADTSILVMNWVEAGALARSLGLDGHEPDALARILLERGPDLVVITLGGDGARAWRRDGPPLRQAAFPVDVVDTLGAGDAFAAGLATALAEGRDLREALRRASACGSMACAGLGVLAHLPERAALERFMEADALALTAPLS